MAGLRKFLLLSLAASAAVVVLMTWLWLSALIILIGAEIASETERQLSGAAG